MNVDDKSGHSGVSCGLHDVREGSGRDSRSASSGNRPVFGRCT